MVESSSETAIVIDNGSYHCKCGLAGYDTPSSSFPSIVGRLKMPGMMVGMDGTTFNKDYFIGEEEKDFNIEISH